MQRLPGPRRVTSIGPLMIDWARRHGRVIDVGFVAAFVVGVMLPLPHRPPAWQAGSPWSRAALALVLAGLLLVRWRRPRFALGGLVLVTLATWGPPGGEVVHVTLPFAGYAVGVSLDRRGAIHATALALLALLLPVLTLIPGLSNGPLPHSDPSAVSEAVAWTALGCFLGMAVASQRQYMREARERIRTAELSREWEAARRVAEERLRISRELHDVVAHHVAVINIQAGAAGHLLNNDPGAARDALANVRRSAQSVLTELAAVLNVLRQGPGLDGPQVPAPGIDEIPRLVSTSRQQGQEVLLDVEGTPRDVTGGVALAAYRVVQEALTNVHKHAPGSSSSVLLTWADDGLTVVVSNGRSGHSASARGGAGFGLIGMRERVTAIGGTFEAGPTADGRYTVKALLPLDGSAT